MSNGQPMWWFRKKEVGFGWGLPARWQGWVTLGVYFALLGICLSPAAAMLGQKGHLVVAGVLTAALVAVIVLKGEPLQRSRETGGETRESERRFDSYRISAYLISALFIVLSIPLALGLVPKNGAYGFRVPSTLAGTSTHWYHVNEVAGLAGIAAGGVALIVTTAIARRVSTSKSWRGPAMLLLTIALILAASVPPFLVN